ncbi:hypothetical protein HRR83_002238 [Exophiala dermatitidis]|uniref:Bacteriophage T5 Orf172 DNA-binding domain-containing protein n=2 Tax=Exophiala dermatitidis TaxID=5970 RepID=H6BYA6_EXODN|nr:uncharacterized protein HMPREF1120_04749 [Exophiala dermatitidis NIH/UT8656]KAJ4524120.1 hypothetical protein HRR74_002315 [Exophiala dermatitidis]EHY56674.1 hypothetical protein HMPREF1120_04749 [Exophiala dermatitidis NIH/UT8656]KAJ4525608.1 hypothetical protein HRR73_002340 [Exophiala dermatitidis]KAJ4536925.1 hypothetical protein HRR76_004952 [Exophiala dermatitidis]KAJ4555474.1 hypothetical protein HRR77_001403 [Exophiala dermatitidis]
MSFSGRTPESLLPRSDSKNPATTCRGITSTGRPCRRALASTSPRDSPAPSPNRGVGVLAVLDQEHAAAFYCWQHKDQAEQLAAKNDRKTTSLHPLKEKSSIDTLVERVGILNLDEDILDQQKRHRRHHRHGGGPGNSHGPSRRETLPSGWNEMQSPLMSVPEEVVRRNPRPRPRPPPPPPPRSNVKFSWACCIRADDDDEDLPPPARVRSARARRPPKEFHAPRLEMQQAHDKLYMTSIPQSLPVKPTPPRPTALVASSSSPTHSQTQTFLSIIPPHLSPQATSLLLSELSRPISPSDEAGYIYIFWLTPETDVSKPDDETASALLDDDDDDISRTTASAARTNQTLTRYASVRHTNTSSPSSRSRAQPVAQRTITLKIGRASNVHRRMSQWTKQCGQNITLIRFYPYTGSSGHGRSGVSPARKVPHVHRVERLIHLELAEKRVVKTECEQCGREHREWFEIEATRAGLKAVDEVVRRWVAWAERQ